MGRVERRRAERRNRIEERKGKILISKDDLKDIKKEITQDATDYTVESLMTCFALALHRKYGFGAKRIGRALEYVDKLMEDIINDKATMEDYMRDLEKETGVVVKCEDQEEK